MGADWYSMTCIGLKVPREKVIAEVEEIVSRCKCKPKTDPEAYPEAKYCHKCGELLRRPVKVRKSLYDAFAGDYYNDEVEIKGWTVEHDTDAYNFYICIFTSGRVDIVSCRVCQLSL